MKITSPYLVSTINNDGRLYDKLVHKMNIDSIYEGLSEQL